MEQMNHILVIEDDSAVAHSLMEGIGREGYDVHWEATGGGGVAYARDRGPHLVILDVRLPDGSGFDVCRRIRALGLRMPVIILTVQDAEVDMVVGLEVGADDYLIKPYHLRELIARVQAQMRRAYGPLASLGADVLYVADLVIDRSRGAVTRGSRKLVLTPTELRLLVHFAQHPRQVFSRAQLLDALWDYGSDPADEKTVNVHVRRLREKVEADPASPRLIVTVRGLGYRLSV